MLPFLCLLLISIQQILVSSQIAGRTDQQEETRLIISVQIKNYSSSTTNGNGCICSTGLRQGDSTPSPKYNCSYLTVTSKCHIKFATMFGIDEKITNFNDIGYVLLDSNGELPQQSKDIWSENVRFGFPRMPSYIGVHPVNYGTVTTAYGEIMVPNSKVIADKFPLKIKDMHPKTSDSQYFYDFQSKGTLSGTSLSVSLSVECLKGFNGPFCDLRCTAPEANSDLAHCVSVETGDFSVCRRLPSGLVDQCQKSSWGVKILLNRKQ